MVDGLEPFLKNTLSFKNLQFKCKQYVQRMNITLLLGTFYALASLSAGCFSTKTNKYHLIPYYVNQIKIEQFLPL